MVHQSGGYLSMAKSLLHKYIVNEVLSPEASPAKDKTLIFRITGNEESRLPPALDGFDSFSHSSEKILSRDPRHRFFKRPLPGVIDIVPIPVYGVSELDW
jgi:hypothetical protein|tara:strand:+ start:905 stop:1204 length:300 start_codon:yes stop_codon:yes gene_type:complete